MWCADRAENHTPEGAPYENGTEKSILFKENEVQRAPSHTKICYVARIRSFWHRISKDQWNKTKNTASDPNPVYLKTE